MNKKTPINRLNPTDGMNAGQLFEIDQAIAHAWRRDGRPNHTDIIVDTEKGGRIRIEHKFFTDYIDPQTGKRVMHPAHLPAFDRDRDVLEQLKEYCRTFDRLRVGHGNFWSGEFEVFELSRAEAYEWMSIRLQAKKGYNELRLKWKGLTVKSGGSARVLETMRNQGWKI